jgi:hypothetical protein
MTIEVLYFDGCPGHHALLPRLRALLADAGVEDTVEFKRVTSAEDALRERFLGSPTLRINGRDVDPSAEHRDDFGLKCRLYLHPHGLHGAIPDDLISVALTSALAHGATQRSPASTSAEH